MFVTLEQELNSKLTSRINEDCWMVGTQGEHWKGSRMDGKDLPRTEHEGPEIPGFSLVVWQCGLAEACTLGYLGVWP